MKKAVRQINGILHGVGLLLVTASLLAAGGVAAGAATYKGAPVHIGQGTARTVVRTDATGMPSSVAVMLTPGALQGLSTTLNKKTAEGSWEYPLPMPMQGPKTGYTEVVIDWNPHGHPPPHIYTVPHFDFHFYGIDPATVEQISFTGPTDPATKVSDAALIPPHYQVIPDTAVNQMGVHAIDTTAPEFHGKPFTATFIYGYYKGQLIFLEPMVTRAFLLTKPNLSLPVKTPAQYSRPGYYPASYSVRYDAHSKAYLVELGGLTHWTSAAKH
jgi:hypothetical protein